MSSTNQASNQGVADEVSTDSSSVQFFCPECKKSFRRRGCLNRHLKRHSGAKPCACTTCGRLFTRTSDMKKHVQRFHQLNQAGAGSSNASTASFSSLSNGIPRNIEGLILVESVAQNRLLTYRINPEGETADCLHTFLSSIKDSAVEVLQRNLQGHPSIKTNIFMEAVFKKVKEDDFDYCTYNLKTTNQAIYRQTNLEEFFDTLTKKLETERSECEMKGSGWSFSHVKWLELRMNRFSPLRGGL